MAGIKRCIGVDLGGQSVKMVEMAVDKGGVRIVRMLTASVPVGPDALETERANAMVLTVRNMIKQNRITTKQAVFCMPGQTVFVRRLRLPKVPGPRLAQIVQFEARQVIPFPLEKTMMQYQVFDTGDAREVEVLLVAMKKETNDDFMRLVRRMGLRPVDISISTLALFNGQELRRFNVDEWLATARSVGGLMGLLGKKQGAEGKAKKTAKPKAKAKKADKKKGKGELVETAPEEEYIPVEEETTTGDDLQIGADTGFEEVRAYVNIGARATDMAICKAGGAKNVGFTRTIPIGGDHVTLAILKQCGCESFTQAEEIKRTRTAVRSALFEMEADPAAYDERACQAATTVSDRIIAELRRSVDYYISQPDGVAVDLVVLSGGGAHLPYLQGYVEERLSVPAEISTGLGQDKIKVPSQFMEGFDFSPYKIAVGLASQGLGMSPIDVDFLPADIRTMRDFGSQYAEMAVLAAMVVGMVFVGSQIGGSVAPIIQKDIDALNGRIPGREVTFKAAEKAKAEHKKVDDKLQAIRPLFAPRDFWLRFLARVQDEKPPEVLLTAIWCQPNYNEPYQATVKIQGEAEQQGSVVKFVNNLKDEPRTAGADSLVPRVSDDLSLGSTQTDSAYFGRPVYTFTFSVVVQDLGDSLITRLLDKDAFQALQAKAAAPGAASIGAAMPPSGLGGASMPPSGLGGASMPPPGAGFERSGAAPKGAGGATPKAGPGLPAGAPAPE
jgi:Tfp pilus assembly PilM family ATPase